MTRIHDFDTKIGKKLLNTGAANEEIYNAKIELAKELKNYDKVKNNEQIKALVDFLEYLFLIEDPVLENKYEEFTKSQGGVFNMSVDKIRKIHYTQKCIEQGIKQGIEQGRKEEKIKIARNLLDILDIEIVAEKTGISIEELKKLKN